MPGRVRALWAASILSGVLWMGVAPAYAGARAVTGFPRIPVWSFSGAWQDSSTFFPDQCIGAMGARPDSIRLQPRTVTVRFLRDRAAETRHDFGGYRVYRMEGAPDTTKAVLVRRFSVNHGDDVLWHFSRVDSATGKLFDRRCAGIEMTDSVITFVDPDSSGRFEKVCRTVDQYGRCTSPGDSLFRLIAPPGPHNGFRLWYAVTYEALNIADNNFEDMYVPDSTDQLGLGPCGSPGNRTACPNLNNKLLNLTSVPVEPTSGPSRNLLGVAVVPNPFRAVEAWDQPGGHEVHFINLPSVSTIRIYTVSGELVRELNHNDAVHDFERWDLRNADNREVASGIYMYRVTSSRLEFQNRFIVIR